MSAPPNVKKFLLFFIFVFFVFGGSAFAEYTTDFTLSTPDNKTDIDYTTGKFNNIGEIKIQKTDASANFEPFKKVVVTVTYSNKLENESGSSSVNYKLVAGNEDNGKTINSGETIEFFAASIDAGAGINIGAVITGDASTLPDDFYRDKQVSFTAELKNIEAGDTVQFGTYSGNKLKWRVINDNVFQTKGYYYFKNIMLITEKAIMSHCYDVKASGSTWSGSWAQNWLNGKSGTGVSAPYFIDGFTEDEKNKIFKASDNDVNVFLLSVSSANNFTQEQRICYPLTGNDPVDWWLADNVAGTTNNIAYVAADGTVNNTTGSDAARSAKYIRPVIFVTIEKGEMQ